MGQFKYIFLIALAGLSACKKGDDTTNPDNFNRTAVIENMVDNLILPSYDDFIVELNALESAFNQFDGNTSIENLSDLRNAWMEAYLAWQDAAMWTFGPAESQGLITAMNIYPTDTAQILSNISGTYDLGSIAQIDAQGFPALDYLLNSEVDMSDAAVRDYFSAIVTRMRDKTLNTRNQWTSYREDFISMTGTDQGSALGILFNYTILPYLEVHQREAKFGIPGGQRTGSAQPSKVEAPFIRNQSQALASRAFAAYRRAWMGMSQVDHSAGSSLMDYLSYMDDRNSTQLNSKLQGQLDEIQLAIDGLDNDFYLIAQSNPQLLNDVWAQYQMMVFTIKTEVSSSLNVTISYVDSDGD